MDVIAAVGIDVVLVERFAGALTRTPLLADRLFTEAERTTPSGNPRSPESLAARFAAKEAVAKALGAPGGLHWHDCEIVSDPDGRPWLTVAGTVAAAAAAGLASQCAALLGHLYGAKVLLLVGSGDNGGDTLYAGARLARRGASVRALLLSPERVHAGGLAALRSAGGSTVDRPPSTVD